ncbi:unnamed protein product, partial [Didymodactylos carnosus]
ETMDSQMTDQSKLIYLLQGLKLSLHKEVARQEPKTPLEFIQVYSTTRSTGSYLLYSDQPTAIQTIG